MRPEPPGGRIGLLRSSMRQRSKPSARLLRGLAGDDELARAIEAEVARPKTDAPFLGRATVIRPRRPRRLSHSTDRALLPPFAPACLLLTPSPCKAAPTPMASKLRWPCRTNALPYDFSAQLGPRGNPPISFCHSTGKFGSPWSKIIAR